MIIAFLLLIVAFYAIASFGTSILGIPLDFVTRIVVSIVGAGAICIGLGKD